jgi:hypothetical protein
MKCYNYYALHYRVTYVKQFVHNTYRLNVKNPLNLATVPKYFHQTNIKKYYKSQYSNSSCYCSFRALFLHSNPLINKFM